MERFWDLYDDSEYDSVRYDGDYSGMSDEAKRRYKRDVDNYLMRCRWEEEERREWQRNFLSPGKERKLSLKRRIKY